MKLIKWRFLPWPHLKLNTDGASKQTGDSGGGSVIRDSHGSALLAFSHYYVPRNSIMAEARALLDGRKYLKTITAQSAFSECDSLVLVQVISRKVPCPSVILIYVRKFWNLLSENDSITHIFREANKVADSLANLACNVKCNSFFLSQQQLPNHIKGATRMDKLSQPSIHLM